MDDKQLAEWEALAKAATEGPWSEGKRAISAQPDPPNGPWEVVARMDTGTVDSRFIAAARAAVPALVAEVRRLQAVALTFEDEADAAGAEVRRLRGLARAIAERGGEAHWTLKLIDEAVGAGTTRGWLDARELLNPALPDEPSPEEK